MNEFTIKVRGNTLKAYFRDQIAKQATKVGRAIQRLDERQKLYELSHTPTAGYEHLEGVRTMRRVVKFHSDWRTFYAFLEEHIQADEEFTLTLRDLREIGLAPDSYTPDGSVDLD